MTHRFSFKISAFAIFFALIFTMGFLIANAQEETAVPAEETAKLEAEATSLVNLDQNITAADFGVGEPTILPGNPLYAFKGIGRAFQSFTTRDPIKKAELKLKFANEKLIEANKLEEGGAADTAIVNAVARYEKEVARVKIQIEKLQDGVAKTEIEATVKRTADNQLKHHRLLGKFMQEHEGIAPEIEEAKAAAMKNFSESMAAVVDPQVLGQKFEEAIKDQKGSAFRHFKHIEVLEEVKDFVPAPAKDAIQNAIAQSSKLFEEEFKATTEDQREIFNRYIGKIGGNEVRHLEAFDAINSFADIEKGIFEEMGRAREKTRSRVEARMKNIKDETRKKVFIGHLEDAKMEDLRIVKELENNLAPETISSVLSIKHTMEQKMREKFENAQTQDDLDSFFKEIEDAPDVRMLEVMKEMEQIIPPDKKEFFEEMKKKAVTEMQKGLEEARKFGRLEAQLQQVAGVDPEHAAVLDTFEGEFGPQLGFFQDIQREQAERMRERFEHFREFSAERPEDATYLEQAEAFRLRIQQDPTAQANIQQFAPEISQDFQKFDAQRKQHGFEEKDVTRKIDDAQIAIQQLSSLLENASQDTPGIEAARSLLENARKHLEGAQGAQTGGESGASFGQAVSAFQNATNGIRKLEKGGFEEERHKYFEKRDEFREKFKGVPAAERPTFEAGVPVKPPSFEDFKFERFRGAPETGVAPEEDFVCAQVITPARHSGTGACRTFPNACLPPGWVAESACEAKGEIHKVLPRFVIPEDERQNFIELEKRHREEFKKREGEIRVTPTKEEQERLEERRRTEPRPLDSAQGKPFEEQKQFEGAPHPAPTTQPQFEPRFLEKILSPVPQQTTPLPSPTPTLEQQKIIQPPATAPTTELKTEPIPTSGSAPSSGGGFSQ